MNSSGYWERSSSGHNNNNINSSINLSGNTTTTNTNESSNIINQRIQPTNQQQLQSDFTLSSDINNITSSSDQLNTSQRFFELINNQPIQHEVQLQPQFTPEEIQHSINNNINSSFLSGSNNNDQNNSIRFTNNNFMQSIDEDDELNHDDERLQETFQRMNQNAASFNVDDDDNIGEDEEEEEEEGEEENGDIDDDFDAIDHDMISHGTTTSHIHRHNSRNRFEEEDDDEEDEDIEERIQQEENSTSSSSQPSLEQIQKVYYTKGLQELDNLQLVDLSPLATWKLSSYKQGFGLAQLREDNPESYWQSDGSNGGNNTNPNSSNLVNNHLNNPHSITIQFIKKVSLERISIFTNYSLDESYTPSKIKIMAGSSEGWDLIEVCTVNFNQPIGWSHIIFNGMRKDAVLKCFMIKIFILANHQEGKDSHIRAIRCFGRKNQPQRYLTSDYYDKLSHSTSLNKGIIEHSDLLKDLSIASGSTSLSGISLNQRVLSTSTNKDQPINHNEPTEDENDIDEEDLSIEMDPETSRILKNVNDVVRNNVGFQSLELTSVSSIR
ncbi:hypothetical protein KGF54_004443 [Candida jiufengensis]|uniref:uncharacterized protein n=1 Tax=Candida jiufengensis TaxID=497108 RepID=UPI002224D60F|nr:uncharacterized protein KGF54_004443 [Candida jiufengensis]KAI5951369.1 hypothetical protein KGF54_004443 [Candida jiufengensis]